MAFVVIGLMQVVQCLNRMFESVLSESAFSCSNSLHVCFYQTWSSNGFTHGLGTWVESKVLNLECRVGSGLVR